MREILFRGKTQCACEGYYWVYGDLDTTVFSDQTLCVIRNSKTAKSYTASRKTIGQYTGLKDVKGNKIFEWDIIEAKKYTGYEKVTGTLTRVIRGIIKYYPGGYFGIHEWYLDELRDIKVIGNIHQDSHLLDNPELLKGDE